MKRFIALAILLLLGFYVAWPAWSGYRIAAALKSRDAELLSRKIDFPSVRSTLRPVVAAEVGKELEKQSGNGLGQLVSGDFKKQLVPKLVDMILEKVVTAENVIRLASEGGDLSGNAQKIIMEQLSKAGGIPGLPLPGLSSGGGANNGLPGGLGNILGGAGGAAMGGIKGLPGGLFGAPKAQDAPTPPATPAAPPAATTKPSYGLSNIKRFALTGPAGYSISLGRDPAVPKPDATVELRFTDFDWKITSLVPHLN